MPSKRSNTEGSIYRDHDRDRWVAAMVVGWKPHPTKVQPGGAPLMVPIRRKFTGPTRKAVTAKLDAAKLALDHGLAAPDNRTTIAEFAEWWIAEILPGEGLAPSTTAWYIDMARTYVVPALGHRTLAGPKAVTVADVEAMTSALDRRGLSPRVQNIARTTAGKMLRAAEQRGLVTRNVARLAKRPGDKGAARKIKAFAPAEVAALLTAVEGTPWHPIIVVGVTTGLRPGELLALHWGDVHLDRDPHVSIRHAISHVGGPTLKAPKRARSHRTVPLAPEAVQAFKARRSAQAAERLVAGPLWSPDWPGLVFTAPDGRPWRVDSLRHAMTRAMPGAHPHRLRHTYATHLLEQGVALHHVAEMVGDSSAVVEATYSHVMRTKNEVAGLVSGILGA